MGESRGCGVRCPACRHTESMVEDTRHRNGYIRRRRSCVKCGEGFSTKESLVVRRAKMGLTADDELQDHLQGLVGEIDALVLRLATMREALVGPPTEAPEAPPA